MCRVIGYIGNHYSKQFIVEGLKKLEYGGYDSAGFACVSPESQRIVYVKSAGSVDVLVKELQTSAIDGFLGIGHTRWATHGISTRDNAHPHFDCQKTISLVHNGIIENHTTLKHQLLASGHVFHSDTDTEVAAHLLESLLAVHDNLKDALIDFCNQLEGAFALICILQDYSDIMVLIRKRSALCIGIGENEMFASSDVLAFAHKTSHVLYMPDESFSFVYKDHIELYDLRGNVLPYVINEMVITNDINEKNGYEHFMLKEIYEQKSAIYKTIEFLKSIDKHVWEYSGLKTEDIEKVEKISIIGCGSSWHAARIAQFFFEQICFLPTSVYLASEFRYMPLFSVPHTLYITISQSGETADTLEALRLIQHTNAHTLALTNVSSSTIVREAQGFLLTHAGREIAVASTKAFSTQLVALYWLAHRIAYEKKIISPIQFEHMYEEILVTSEILENCIENYKRDINQIHAPYYAQFKKAIFLGRHISYPFAMEAALKLKEIAYIFAQGYPAGELKHGPLALIDSHIPVFIFSHQDNLIYQKLVSNAQEVKARKGHIVAFAFEGQTELQKIADTTFIIPVVKPLLGPLAMTGLMHYFVYSIAQVLGCPIDQPRNLAKSVTVE